MSTTNTFDLNLPHCQFWFGVTAPQLLYCEGWSDYNELGMKRLDWSETDEEWKESFIESWGIDTREEWHDMIRSLAHGEVHGDAWSGLFARRACNTAGEWQNFIAQQTSAVAQGELRFADMVFRLVGTQGFLAWDYCRGSFLTRAGIRFGLVSDEEGAFLLNYFSQNVRQNFTDWPHYIRSFILGRAYWVYSKADESEQLNQLDKLLNKGLGKTFDNYFDLMHNDKAFPLNHVDWNTPLPNISMPKSLQEVLDTISAQQEAAQ